MQFGLHVDVEISYPTVPVLSGNAYVRGPLTLGFGIFVQIAAFKLFSIGPLTPQFFCWHGYLTTRYRQRQETDESDYTKLHVILANYAYFESLKRVIDYGRAGAADCET